MSKKYSVFRFFVDNPFVLENNLPVYMKYDWLSMFNHVDSLSCVETALEVMQTRKKRVNFSPIDMVLGSIFLENHH